MPCRAAHGNRALAHSRSHRQVDAALRAPRFGDGAPEQVRRELLARYFQDRRAGGECGIIGRAVPQHFFQLALLVHSQPEREHQVDVARHRFGVAKIVARLVAIDQAIAAALQPAQRRIVMRTLDLPAEEFCPVVGRQFLQQCHHVLEPIRPRRALSRHLGSEEAPREIVE